MQVVMIKSARQIALAGLVLLSLGLLWDGPAAVAREGHQHERVPNVMEYLHRLDDPERDEYQKPTQVVDALGLKPGMHVADLGAGSGYFTRRFVEAVGETGKVYVVDIEPEALKHVERRLGQLHRPFEAVFILATQENPKIPSQSVDLIFICNTYHHLENRTEYARNLKSSLRPGGRIAIIDFYHDDRSGELGFPKRHLVAKENVLEELREAGYRLVKEHTFLPKQYFLELSTG
jgi:arsenite methyltransferase